ncbi:MAG TPA: type II toxin-antitoxin system RelE/ParE family toxin [Nitrospira sp.]|nr:type II toxin-antitoxin system RelE/ParE family toxin [Chloroflexia bacterium]HNK16668.1 type II toxin-antitoxin system RelE/ParE family toxin [Nitrospira sp.]
MSERPLGWLGSSQDDLRDFPGAVRVMFGVALFEAQKGGTHEIVKALKGYKGHLVFQASEDFDGDTYRVIYVTHPEAVYVVHAFKKKSTRGIATPQADKDLITERLKTLVRRRKEHHQ